LARQRSVTVTPLVDPTGSTKGAIMPTGTTAIGTAPILQVSHSGTSPSHGRSTRRWALVAVASVSLVAGSISLATRATANDEFENRCAPTGQGSADSLERQALACQAALDEAYVACMRDAAGTPDSAERWVDYCQTRALG
jgi:hypothetical protein